jgi:hypothetical protein
MGTSNQVIWLSSALCNATQSRLQHVLAVMVVGSQFIQRTYVSTAPLPGSTMKDTQRPAQSAVLCWPNAYNTPASIPAQSIQCRASKQSGNKLTAKDFRA